MFALKKILDFRQSAGARRGAWQDHEKPFLDHLEDLRRTLFKLIITITIALFGCLAFHQQFFNILLTPLKIAQLDRLDLPDGVDSLRWNRAKLWAEILAELPTAQARAAYLERITAIDHSSLDHQRAHRHLPQLSDLPEWMHSLGGRKPDQEQAQAHGVEGPVQLETLLEAAAVYRAADSLKLDPKEKKRGEAPDGFIRAAASPGAAELVLELWAKDAKPEVSPLATTLEMQALGPPEAFMMSMKIAMYAAIVVAFPFLLYFLAEFILPGLTPRERKALYPAVGIGFGLFFVGVLFAFFVVVPRALTFFHDWGSDLGLSEQWRIGYYISFVTQLTLIFGVSFELPVIVLTLVKLGLVSVTMLRSGRLWAYLIIMIVGAVITPTPDAFTLSLLAGPMLVLYEITVLIAARMEKREAKRAADEERHYRERALRPALAVDADGADGADGAEVDGDAVPSGPAPASGPEGGLSPARVAESSGEVAVKPRTGLTPAFGPHRGSVPSTAGPAAAGPATDDPLRNADAPGDPAADEDGAVVSDGPDELGPEPDRQGIDWNRQGWPDDYVDPYASGGSAGEPSSEREPGDDPPPAPAS